MSKTYRLTGILYVAIIALGLFSELFVRGSVTASGDPSLAAAQIQDHATLFRVGIASDLLMFVFDVAVAALLYLILAPFDRGLALLSSAFRLTGSAVYAANLLNQVAAQLILGHVDAASGESLSLFYMELQSLGYDLGLVFFGVHCLLLGAIFYRATDLPRWIGGLLAAGGAGYLLGSFTVLLAPDFADVILPIYVVPLVAELALAVWLIRRGGQAAE